MTCFNYTVNLAVQNAWKHPLSTLMGLFTLIGGGYTVLMTDPDYTVLRNAIPVKWAGRIALTAVIIKFCLRALSKDVDREEAKVPGKAEPQMVEAHAVPDDPAAKILPK